MEVQVGITSEVLDAMGTIELHLPTGELLWGKATQRGIFIGRNGKGQIILALKERCIPHTSMCGPFSRDVKIKYENRIHDTVEIPDWLRKLVRIRLRQIDLNQKLEKLNDNRMGKIPASRW